MATRIPFSTIVGPLPLKINLNPVGDTTETMLVTVVRGTAPARAAVYAMARDGTVRFIGESEPIGKDDSASAAAYRDGTVLLVVCEADPVPGSPGSSTDATYYLFPGAVPPFSAPGGQADVTALTARVNRHLAP